MSQPLTGVIRRRLKELSVPEGWFLLALADMVDSETRQWRESWHRLALRLGRKHDRKIRQTAYRLRDDGWLTIQSDGRSVLLTLTPERGCRRADSSSAEVGTKGAYQVGTKSAYQIGTGSAEEVGTIGATIDSPLNNPLGRNAPVTPSSLSESVSAPMGGDEGSNGMPSPLGSEKGPGRPIPPKPTPEPKRRRLGLSERISFEREIARLTKEIDRVRDRHESNEDWTVRERQNVKRWKLRVDECCLQIDQEPVYNAPPA